MPISVNKINDILVATLDKAPTAKFTEVITRDFQHDVYKQWFKKESERISGGTKNMETIATRSNNAARLTTLFDNDSVSITDMFSTVEVPWAYADTHWAFDIRERFMNSGGKQIVDVIRTRRWDAIVSLAKLLEKLAWSVPDPAEEKAPFGIPYWIVKDKREGFYGLRPEGFSHVGNIDPVKEEGWRNWTAAYKDVSDDDLLEKMRRAYRHLQWSPPEMVDGLRHESHKNYRIYVNDETYGKLAKLQRNQRMDIGWDLYNVENEPTFRGHTIVYTQELDNDESCPVYMVNHDVIGARVMKGDVFNETPPERLYNSHYAYAGWVNLTFAFFCTNRARHAVVAKSID